MPLDNDQILQSTGWAVKWCASQKWSEEQYATMWNGTHLSCNWIKILAPTYDAKFNTHYTDSKE